MASAFQRIDHFIDVHSFMLIQTANERSVFTVAELGNQLPPAFRSSRGADKRWMCVNEMKSSSEDGKIRFAETEADARANMLIYLIENGMTNLTFESA